MPSELAKQKPEQVFYILNSMIDEKEQIDYDNLPDNLKMFYGK